MSEKSPTYKKAYEIAAISQRYDDDIQRAQSAGRYDVSSELTKMKMDELRREQDEQARREMELIREKRIRELRFGLTEIEAKEKDLKEQMKKKKQETVEEEGEGKKPVGINLTGTELLSMQGLPEEQRNWLMQIIAMVNAGQGGGQMGGWMMPAMLMGMQKNPQMTPVDMLNMANSLFNTIKGAIQPQSNDALITTMFNTLKELMVQNRGTQPQGVWDQILGDKEKFERMRELFGGNQAGAQQISLEYAKIQNDYEIRKAELAQKNDLEKQKVDVERDRNTIMADSIGRVAEAVGGALASREPGGGEEAPPVQKRMSDQAQTEIRQNIGYQKCPQCGEPVYIGNPLPNQTFKCARCGHDLTWSSS